MATISNSQYYDYCYYLFFLWFGSHLFLMVILRTKILFRLCIAVWFLQSLELLVSNLIEPCIVHYTTSKLQAFYYGQNFDFCSSTPVTCVICSRAHCHLFLECPFTNGIWSSVLFKCGVPQLRLPRPLFVTWAASRWKEKSLSSIEFELCLATTVYHVWRERNNHRLKNLFQPTIRLWLSSLKIAHTAATKSTLREWNIPMNSYCFLIVLDSTLSIFCIPTKLKIL